MIFLLVFFNDLIKFEPTNPAPPVTIMRYFRICLNNHFRVLRQSTIGGERLELEWDRVLHFRINHQAKSTKIS